MKAVICRKFAPVDALEIGAFAAPAVAPGTLLIDVAAAGVNFPDGLMVQGKYQTKPPVPFVPGSELGGVVRAVGEGVSGFAVGDRIVAFSGTGGFAEQAVVPAPQAFPVPAGADLVVASGMLITYGTSYHALKDRAALKLGETLLVLGAAGGVGLAAVELGKAYGAKVVAAVSSEEKAAVAREHGADEVVVYPRAPLDKDQSKALAEAFKAACGPNGADVIYDIIGGDYSEPAVRSIAWEGRFCVVGFTAGIAKLPLNLTLLKSCDVCGVFWGAFAARDPQANAKHIATLFDLLKAGKINPKVSATFPLERGGEAIQLLADRKAIGKVVVTMN